jgi:cell division protease FtsH
VAGLLREAEVAATKLIRDHRAALDRVIDLLIERETIDGSELDFITGVPKHTDQPELVLSHRAAGLKSAADRCDPPGPV